LFDVKFRRHNVRSIFAIKDKDIVFSHMDLAVLQKLNKCSSVHPEYSTNWFVYNCGKNSCQHNFTWKKNLQCKRNI